MLKDKYTGNENGFTLAELMVVVVIVAVMALFGAPLIEGLRPKMRLKTASRDLHTNLEKMKLEAIKRNRTALITLTPIACPPAASGGSYTIHIDNDKSGTVNAGDTQLIMDDSSGDAVPDYDYDMPQSAALCINADLPATTVFRFSSRGFWLDAAGNPLATTFDMQNTKGDSYAVNVSISGSINSQ